MKAFKQTFNQNGFTLIECLLSLLIASLVMHALFVAIAHYHRLMDHQAQDQTVEWHQFKILLTEELKSYDQYLFQNQQIRLWNHTTPSQRDTILLSNQRIYRTPGFYPLLYQVASWSLEESDGWLFILLEFTNGQFFAGQVALP